MSENVQENKEPQFTETPGFTPINSQEELDRIIGNRLAREREKFSDYEALKEKAGKLAEVQESAQADLEAKQQELDKAITELDGLKAAKQAADTREQIADKFGIPAGVLRGSTEEELTAHAETLTKLINSGPVVPTAHVKPGQARGNDALSAVKQLFK